MGKVTGFLEISRALETYGDVSERLNHYREFALRPEASVVQEQGARCMDCGIPYCESGCPVSNIIPDWNDLVWKGNWKEASEILHSTNNFPEFTGRICPAPCEAACTLNINDDPVTIKSIEREIADRAWDEGWVVPRPPSIKNGHSVAVIGSGPSGLACAQQLARAGHRVVVFEKNELPGGLLRFGIPDFKMEKHLIDRRIDQMKQEGVEFQVNTHVSVDVSAENLLSDFSAIALCCGSEHPRDMAIPGRELSGIHFAMPFLSQQNRRVAGLQVEEDDILASGKNVIVIGGGDTGSDCIGTSNRQKANNVVQLELMPKPPTEEDKSITWPKWPLKLRTSTSHLEGCDREWSVGTKAFLGDGSVNRLQMVRLDWHYDANGRMQMKEIPESEFEIEADLVLLAMGYLHPRQEGILRELGVNLDSRGNVAADTSTYQTSVSKVFAAGDARRGQSLVVWAIREGRRCAYAVDTFLTSSSYLPCE